MQSRQEPQCAETHCQVLTKVSPFIPMPAPSMVRLGVLTVSKDEASRAWTITCVDDTG